MKTFSSLMQNKVAFGLSIIVSVFLVVSLVSAATTISTNIVTEGTLAVTQGATLSSTLDVTGLSTLGSVKVGSTGTTISQIVKGTCVLTNYGVSGTGIDVSHAASTTVLYQCAATAGGTALTGVASGDTTFVQFATTTLPVLNGWAIVGSNASSTAGYINVLVSNLTGTARVPSTDRVGSTTSFIIVR